MVLFLVFLFNSSTLASFNGPDRPCPVLAPHFRRIPHWRCGSPHASLTSPPHRVFALAAQFASSCLWCSQLHHCHPLIFRRYEWRSSRFCSLPCFQRFILISHACAPTSSLVTTSNTTVPLYRPHHTTPGDLRMAMLISIIPQHTFFPPLATTHPSVCGYPKVTSD